MRGGTRRLVEQPTHREYTALPTLLTYQRGEPYVVKAAASIPVNPSAEGDNNAASAGTISQ